MVVLVLLPDTVMVRLVVLMVLLVAVFLKRKVDPLLRSLLLMVLSQFLKVVLVAPISLSRTLKLSEE